MVYVSRRDASFFFLFFSGYTFYVCGIFSRISISSLYYENKASLRLMFETVHTLYASQEDTQNKDIRIIKITK